MKYASKKFFAAVLACALAWMAGAPEAAFARAEDGPPVQPHRPLVTATLVNKTNAMIFCVVVERRKDDKDGSSADVTGPLLIKPDEKDEIRLGWVPVKNPTKNLNDYKFGVYAESPAAGRVWAGEKETVWPEVENRTYTNDRGEFFLIVHDRLWNGQGVSPTRGGFRASDRDTEEAKKNSKRIVFWPFTAGKNVTLTFTDEGVSIDNQGKAAAQQQKKPAASAKPAKSAINANAAIAGDRVNIRSAPSRKAKALLQLNDGDRVQATGKRSTDSSGDDWYQIKMSSGKIGWVFGRYIDIW